MTGIWGSILKFRKKPKASNKALARQIHSATGIHPKDIRYYELAFRHSSASQQSDSAHWANNERLEFLGDALLGTVVAEELYHRYPDQNEGFLTSMRAKLVNRKYLNQIATNLNLRPLVVSKLDVKKPAHSLMGDVLEALIGAIYLDQGMEITRNFVISKVMTESSLFSQLEQQVVSFKSLFIEYVQRERLGHEFVLKEKWGKNHSLTFKIGLYLHGEEIAEGIGTSKKRAEEHAAELACKHLKITS